MATRCFKPITNLLLVNRAPTANSLGGVTGGVPLPRGFLKSTTYLAVVDDDGNQVDAQFEPAAFWPDGSLRWVLVHMLYENLRHNEKRRYVIGVVQKSATTDTMMTVVSDKSFVEIDNGVFRLRLRRKNFNLIDKLVLSGHAENATLIEPHDEGSFVCLGRETFESSNGDAVISVERHGPVLAVIRMEGSHLSENGKKGLDYVVRFHVWRGLPRVKMDFTFLNRQGKGVKDFVDLRHVGIRLPVAVATQGADVRVVLGAPHGPVSGSRRASILQTATEHCDVTVDGKISKCEGADARSEKTGWGAISGKGLFVGAAVRWFWQTHPKSMSLDADGNMLISMFDGRHDLYQGLSKTTEIVLAVGNAPDVKEVERQRLLLDRPPRLVCAPQWHCSATEAAGRLVEQAKALSPAGRGIQRRMDALLRKGLAALRKRRDGNRDLPVGMDEYGIWNFGDDAQSLMDFPGRRYESPGKVMWNNIYYDGPRSQLHAFLRTGNLDFLDFAETCIGHLRDIDISHYDSRPEFTGGPRHSPAFLHYRSFSDGLPEVHGVFNHLKNQSLALLWCLTGDRRAREAALLVGDHVAKYWNRGADPLQPRSVAHGIFAALAVWQLTNNRRYLNTARSMLSKGMRHARRNGGGYPSGGYSFQSGLMGEAYLAYQDETGDRCIPQTLLALADWMCAQDKQEGAPVIGKGMCALTLLAAYQISNEKKYLDTAFADLKQWTLRSEHVCRDSKLNAQVFRSAQLCLYYLCKARRN